MPKPASKAADSGQAPLTREALAQYLSRRLALSAKDAQAVIAAYLEAVAEGLTEKGAVTISGLGRWQVKPGAVRRARNLATGEPVLAPPKPRIAFEMARGLRNALKHGRKA